MNLTLKDRVLILNTVLPQFDTRKNMELKVSIDSKIAISEVDQKRIVIKDMGVVKSTSDLLMQRP